MKAIVRKTDLKGRNLLHTVVRNLSKDDKSLDRAFEIMRILIDQYGIDIAATDKLGFNILHFCHQNVKTFIRVFEIIPKNLQERMLNQKN